MSAPVVSGVMGILRSINPLVLKGTPSPAIGLRGVLATTTQEAQAMLPWDSKMGYGKPDAEAAAKKLIGTVGGRVIRNRATPLFRMYSSSFSDYADTTSPQFALSLMNSKGGWAADAGTKDVPNYSLPGESAVAKASMYVLTTQYQPRPAWPMLVPLYMMRKSYSGGSRIDYMMATTKAELEAANAVGYCLLNIQGYVYKTCSPDCIPPGAEKLWRKFRSAVNDCAVFLENERTTFEAAGYTAACPAGSSLLLGYAYPVDVDTDNDGLPDGFEYVVGTDPTRADSDGDGSTDGDEFPMTGVPVSDPCFGGTYGATYCYVNDVIFTDGMEAL